MKKDIKKIKAYISLLEKYTGKKVKFLKEEYPKKPEKIYNTITSEDIENFLSSNFHIRDYRSNLDEFKDLVERKMRSKGWDLEHIFSDSKTSRMFEEEVLYNYSYGRIEFVVDYLYKIWPPESLEEYRNSSNFLSDVKEELKMDGVDMKRWDEINSNINATRSIVDYYEENIQPEDEDEDLDF